MNTEKFIRLLYNKPPSDIVQDYYNEIINGFDRQIDLMATWLQSDEAKRLHNKHWEEVQEFFENSGIKEDYNKLLESNASNCTDFVKEFYEMGAKRGYKDLGKILKYSQADMEALNFVREINYEYVLDVNKMLANSIQEAIFNKVASGQSYQKTIKELKELPLEPITYSYEHWKTGETVTVTISADTRARMIAVTENSRARNAGTRQAYLNYGVKYCDVITADDDLVCDDCLDLEANNPHDVAESADMLPAHPYCYSLNTELFTANGWKKISEVTLKDKVLSLNPETEEMIFVNPTGIIANYAEDLIHIHNRWFDMCVTEDHDCFIHQRRMIKGKRVFVPEFRKPDELNSESWFVRCIKPSDRFCPEFININGVKIHKNDYAFLMGWYLSEGSCNRDNYLEISQLKESERDYLRVELKRIANSINCDFFEWESRFALNSKPLIEYVKRFGYSYEKYIPSEVFNLDNEALNIFLESYIRGDGYVRVNNCYGTESVESMIYTSSKRMVSGLSYVIILLGYYPSISISSKKGTVNEFKNGIYESNHDVYKIAILKSHRTQFSACNVDKIEYNDFAYCVDVPPHHTILIKSDGKVSWAGNCRCTLAPHIESPNDVSDEPLEDPECIVDYMNNELEQRGDIFEE